MTTNTKRSDASGAESAKSTRPNADNRPILPYFVLSHRNAPGA